MGVNCGQMSSKHRTGATYIKLESGQWGLRGRNLTPGSTVTVSKFDGSTKTVTVGQIIKSYDGITIAAIECSLKKG